MSRSAADRALRLQRVARAGDLLAKVAEGDLARCRADLEARQHKLEVVQAYQLEYQQLDQQRTSGVVSPASLRRSRDFGSWLVDIEVAQQHELAEGQFRVEAAAEEATQRRLFARSLETLSERATAQAVQLQDKRQQQEMEQLAAGARRQRNLAPELQSQAHGHDEPDPSLP